MHRLTKQFCGALILSLCAEISSVSAQDLKGGNEESGQYASESVATPKDVVNEHKDPVRVNYVPEFIVENIKDELRDEVKDEVIQQVILHAKEHRWGVQDSWPSWLNKVRAYGDVRFRSQFDQFSNDNFSQYLNFNRINRDGGLTGQPGQFINNQEDRERMLLRLRFGMAASYSKNVDVSFRLATGSRQNPVSGNANLANGLGGLELSVDQAFVNIHDANRIVQFIAGRMPNPWFSTSLVWDSDVSFSGATLKTHWEKAGLFLTLGAYPINESALTEDDAWLYGTQLGWKASWAEYSKLSVGLAYYDYQNIEGIRNSFDSNLTDFSAPRFIQKGNTLTDIRNDLDPETSLWALASDYNLLNITLNYTYQLPKQLQLSFLADFVENKGFDEQIPSAIEGELVEAQTQGFLLGFRLGNRRIDQFKRWSVLLAYRELERDAVVDAFTDSSFHLGGTDAKGYEVVVNYGLAKNTWFTLKAISSDEISGAPFGVDTYQFSINAKF